MARPLTEAVGAWNDRMTDLRKQDARRAAAGLLAKRHCRRRRIRPASPVRGRSLPPAAAKGCWRSGMRTDVTVSARWRGRSRTSTMPHCST